MRDKLIRDLRRYARKQGLELEIDTRRGKGSHYLVSLGGRWATVQSDLNEPKVRTILRQLGVDPADL